MKSPAAGGTAITRHPAGASGTTAPVRLRSTPESRVPLRFYLDERVFKGVIRTSDREIPGRCSSYPLWTLWCTALTAV